ncbi:hypothetical protein [Mycolicibacterium fluoranthenivorans]|uniref:Uncharacterized protein n=1 Tax=Mycolicibacterium fluoranthenivorans TaxID=258505 RepID=A0A7X5R4Z0_9MYCO|nr:hypothetical protein [Mycolicibacterium fluoranthenivorans]MCV7355591.1 hypothetical protein [Mycolicibacterium fluoranthenivorans]NIH93161.1 hypothetical protein [Mycolicibacterium fluoranthenivorans]
MSFPVWAGEWGAAPHRAYGRSTSLSRRQARHWSRRFSGVGVSISAPRLRELVAGTAEAGHEATDAEVTDVRFALTALDIEQQRHQATMRRARASAVQAAIFVAVALIALNAMLCLAYLMLSAVPH